MKTKKMKKVAFFLIILLSAQNILAQLSGKIKTKYDSDTIMICRDTTIEFTAEILNGVDTVSDSAYIYWNFDDGDFIEGTNKDTVQHKFVSPGAYRVLMTAKYNNEQTNSIVIVLLGLDPYFTGTQTDIPADQKGICKGDDVKLTGKIVPKTWKEKRQYTRNEIFPVFIDDQHPYSSYITEKYYKPDSVVSDTAIIDSIGVKIEHSLSSSVRISLQCPSGDTVILKDTGGVDAYLGEPVIQSNDLSEGTGYWYYFVNSGANGFMNNYTLNDTLPAGTYTIQGDLNNLVGCPINGKWSLNVEDFKADTNNGYIFAWSLIFDKSKQTQKIEYSNTYDINSSLWLGDFLNLTTQGIATATPETYGSHQYSFLVTDNTGCRHDTTLNVLVEKASLKIDKTTVTIGDSIDVKDQTSWDVSRQWDFGDNSDILTDEEEYKKYEDKGTYFVILTAVSESGCVDYDTAKVEAIPKPIEITDYNIFTPNGDGVNDVFKFFNTPDEKITGANIDKIRGRIYNRYGQAVCKWDTKEEILKGWDGTMNNKGNRPAPDGFYYYVLIITGKDGIKYEPFKGTIYLYRNKK